MNRDIAQSGSAEHPRDVGYIVADTRLGVLHYLRGTLRYDEVARHLNPFAGVV